MASTYKQDTGLDPLQKNQKWAHFDLSPSETTLKKKEWIKYQRLKDINYKGTKWLWQELAKYSSEIQYLNNMNKALALTYGIVPYSTTEKNKQTYKQMNKQ